MVTQMMNNAWCGFLVSDTDCRAAELPLGFFSPPHVVVKQTTYTQPRSCLRLLLDRLQAIYKYDTTGRK